MYDMTLDKLFRILDQELLRFRTIKNTFLFLESVLLISLVMIHGRLVQESLSSYWWLPLAWAVSGIFICRGPWGIVREIQKTMMMINRQAEGTHLQYEAESQIHRIGDISQGADPLNPIFLGWVANAFAFVWLLVGGAIILKWNQVVPALLIVGAAIGLVAFVYDKFFGRQR